MHRLIAPAEELSSISRALIDLNREKRIKLVQDGLQRAYSSYHDDILSDRRQQTGASGWEAEDATEASVGFHITGMSDRLSHFGARIVASIATPAAGWSLGGGSDP